MSENVRPMRVVKAAARQDVINVLKDALAKAESGQLQHVVITGQDGKFNPMMAMAFTGDADLFALAGAMGVQKSIIEGELIEAIAEKS